MNYKNQIWEKYKALVFFKYIFCGFITKLELLSLYLFVN